MKVDGLEAEVDLRGSCSLEALMGSQKGVVAEAELDSAFECSKEQGPEGVEEEKLLEGPPGSFEGGDGAGLSDGAETMLDAELASGVAEELGGELDSPVGDEVLGRAEATACISKEVGKLASGR